MKINKQKLYDELILKVKIGLEKEDFTYLDGVLEYAIGGNLEEDEYMEITDILDEATLYCEFKEKEYKDEALAMIADFEEELK